jgi:hypothetical protein
MIRSLISEILAGSSQTPAQTPSNVVVPEPGILATLVAGMLVMAFRHKRFCIYQNVLCRRGWQQHARIPKARNNAAAIKEVPHGSGTCVADRPTNGEEIGHSSMSSREAPP